MKQVNLKEEAFGSNPSNVLFPSAAEVAGSVGEWEETLILTANKMIKVCMWRLPLHD